jgi:hypothetical protein
MSLRILVTMDQMYMSANLFSVMTAEAKIANIFLHTRIGGEGGHANQNMFRCKSMTLEANTASTHP